MLKIDRYNFEGKKMESISLPKEYEVKPNPDLLLQAIHVYEDRSHPGLSKSKTRGEVRISTRKIYRQKGTGGARHGAKSAPIFVGGGTAHGPKGIKRILTLSKSQKAKSFLYALNDKIIGSGAVVVEGIDKIKKTKDASLLLQNIAKDRGWKSTNCLLALSGDNTSAHKFFRNINKLKLNFFKDVNAYDIFLSSGMVIDNNAIVEKFRSKEDKGSLKVKGAVEKKMPKVKTVLKSPGTIKKATVKPNTAKKGVVKVGKPKNKVK